MTKTNELDLFGFSNLLIGFYLEFGTLEFGSLPVLLLINCYTKSIFNDS